MPDTDDWYNLLEQQLLTTITADSWLGTAGTAVKTREIKLRGDFRSYFDNELPTIAIKVNSKSQVHSSTGDFQKFFKFTCSILNRDGDLDNGVNVTQEIMSQLENVLEGQYTAENNLRGLGTYSLIMGGPIVRLNRSHIAFRNTGQNLENYEVLSTVNGEIELITS